jgi:hypothetical protein
VRKIRDENLDEALVMSYFLQQFDWFNGYRKCEPGHVNGRDRLSSLREADGDVD